MAWPILFLALASSGAVASQQVWDSFGNHGKFKCHSTCKSGGCSAVVDQNDCMNRAEKSGHNFYSYRSFDRMCSTSSSCSPKATAMAWRTYQVMWPEVKPGNYKCHASCRDHGCAPVASQAECQSFALLKGQSFYSYRDFDQMCAVASTCSNLYKTASGPFAWRAFKTPDEKPAVWSMVDASTSRKCHLNCARDTCTPVANIAECQGYAIQAGHRYYSYRSSDHMCATSPTCDSYKVPTLTPWTSFQKMGSTVKEGSFKCHSTCKDNECFPVSTRGECQVKSQARGKSYYSYRPFDKMCAPASSCTNPIPAQVDWRAYEL